MEKDRKLNFDTKIAWDLKICPDLDLWPSVQVQGHFKKSGASITFQQIKYLYFLIGGIICELALVFVTLFREGMIRF